MTVDAAAICRDKDFCNAFAPSKTRNQGPWEKQLLMTLGAMLRSLVCWRPKRRRGALETDKNASDPEVICRNCYRHRNNTKQPHCRYSCSGFPTGCYVFTEADLYTDQASQAVDLEPASC